MAAWFQRILLSKKSSFVFLLFSPVLLTLNSAVMAQQLSESESSKANHDALNTEYFEVGLFTGIMNIEDFDAEPAIGINVTFNADENYFLQFNYLQANASLSSFELSQGRLFSGSDRKFRHYDFLVGYNLFHGELFSGGNEAALSSFNIVLGVGETQFGGEGSFTYTYGLGYQISLNKQILLKIDYRDYIYTTNIIGENTDVDNAMLGIGLSYLF